MSQPISSKPCKIAYQSQISQLSFRQLSQVALHILPLTFIALHLVREAYVIHQCAAAAASLVQRVDTPLYPFTVDHTIVASSHKHVPLLRGAGRGRGFGNVWEVRQSGDVVQKACGLRVGGIAVGVAVFLLNVPA